MYLSIFIVAKLSSCKISIFWLVSSWSRALTRGFLSPRPDLCSQNFQANSLRAFRSVSAFFQQYTCMTARITRVRRCKDVQGRSYIYAKTQVRTHLDQTYGKIRAGKSFSRTPDRDFRCFYPCEIFLPHTPVPALGKDKKKEQPHAGRTSIRDVIVMLNEVTMSHLSVFMIFWKSFSSCFNINEVLSGEQEKNIHYSCEDGIEKSVPRDHRLSSLGKPRDANR